MDEETALQAWKQMRSEIDPDNWLFVGTINPEMVDRAIEALEAVIKEETNCPEIPDSWIPVSKKLPEEKINPNTHDFEEVLCSTTFGDVRAYKFGTPYGWEKPHFWRGLNVMDEYVLAWMEKPEPWKGEQHETD